MNTVTFDLANPADDSALRRILRKSPMPGAITLGFEREPNYFQAAYLEGPFHQTIAARDPASGQVVGMGSRTVRQAYINGAAQPVGYMSQLRVDPGYPWGAALGRIIARGFDFYRQLHQDGQASFYLMSIIAGNTPALRLLQAGLPGYPTLAPYTQLHTFVFSVGRRRPEISLPVGLRIERGCRALLPAIVDCLQRNGARRQFAPYWDLHTLCHPEHTPGLQPGDFIVALKGECVVGCLARWDQQSMKQTVVRGYSKPVAHCRRLLNLLAAVGGWPLLPPPNTSLRHCYASHLAVDEDDPRLCSALVRTLCNCAVTSEYSYFMLGLAADDPLCQVLKRTYRHLIYRSQLYLAAWEDGLDAVRQVDGRQPGLEIAVL